jgi:hypothetical protein
MKAAIVDTDVVSMLFKGDSRAEQYRAHIGGRLLGHLLHDRCGIGAVATRAQLYTVIPKAVNCALNGRRFPYAHGLAAP